MHHQFNCGTVTLHLAFVKNIPVSTGQKKITTFPQHDHFVYRPTEKIHIRTLPQHDDFGRHHGIASSMKNNGATSDLPSSPSLQHSLRLLDPALAIEQPGIWQKGNLVVVFCNVL